MWSVWTAASRCRGKAPIRTARTLSFLSGRPRPVVSGEKALTSSHLECNANTEGLSTSASQKGDVYGDAWSDSDNENHIEGLTYSGCGWLLTYHAGVTDGLRTAGILNDQSKYYGVSGGAICAVTMALGFEPEELLDQVNSVFDDIPRGIRIWGAVDDILQEKFDAYFPDDAHERVKGRLGISVFRVWPSPQPLLINEFESKEDLIATVIASCYIPGYIDGQVIRRYRGGFALDGGVGQLYPKIPGTIPVFPFPVPQPMRIKSRGIDSIGPTLINDFPFSIAELLRGALIPMDERRHRMLFEAGQRSAEAWLERRARRQTPLT